MVFQGDMVNIDPQPSTVQVAHDNTRDSAQAPKPDNAQVAARIMQELRIGEQQERSSNLNGTTDSLQPDPSSSRLTDMLQGVSPFKENPNGGFYANCPSAIPSPLYKIPGPPASMHTASTNLGSSALFVSPRATKSYEDHFYMTNEHLDVVGKSTWDQIESLKQKQLESFNHRHAHLLSTIEKHVKEINMQIDSVHNKVDRSTEQNHNLQTKLEELFDFVKGDVMNAMAAQDKKNTSMEHDLANLQKTVQQLQQTLDQKQSELRHASVAASNSLASPYRIPSHHSQPFLGGYYGNMAELGREAQLPMPPVPNHRGSGNVLDGSSDQRINHNIQRASQIGYQGRDSRDDRGYPSVNPYHYNNGAASNGGHFGNGYSGGYPSYNYNSNSPES